MLSANSGLRRRNHFIFITDFHPRDFGTTFRSKHISNLERAWHVLLHHLCGVRAGFNEGRFWESRYGWLVERTNSQLPIAEMSWALLPVDTG